MPTPTPTLIEIFRGEDVELDFTLDPVENVSGWTMILSVARREGAAPLIEKTLTIVSAAAATFTQSLEAADSADLDVGSYRWSVWRTNTGSARVYARGEFRISASVEPS